MIRTNNLYFRKPTQGDVDEILKLKNNEKAAYLLGGTFHTYSREDIVSWIDFHNNNKEELLLVVFDEDAGKMIGHVGLYKIDSTAKKTEYGILIADDGSRGKGYGTLCTSTLVDYAFNQLGMNKVTAEVLAENKASEAMLRKCGFLVDGVLREDVFKNGRYYDVLSMSVLAKDISK